MDLYVSCLNQPNYLFRNQGANAEGEWQFVNVAHEAGVEEPYDSFPAWFWDFNNDGWTDIFVSGYSLDYFGSFASETAADYLGRSFNAETPRLYQNKGDGTFSNVTEEAGIARPLFAMGSNFGDIDNDGYLDFYLGTGEPDFRSIIPNRMFRNEAGRYFQDVTTVGGFGHLQKGHGVSFGDVDNDGDQDIYAVMGGAYEGDFYPNVLFENPGNENHYITMILEGTRSNRSAIGARIKVVLDTRDGDRNIFSTVSAGGSFGSSSLRQEIGLSDALAIKHIEVTWPATGIEQILSNVNIDSSIRVVEGHSGFTYMELPKVDLARSSHGSGH